MSSLPVKSSYQAVTQNSIWEALGSIVSQNSDHPH